MQMKEGNGKTGIVYDDSFLLHDTGPWHPESPERLKVARRVIDDMGKNWIDIEARPAMRDELLQVHESGYVDRVLNLETLERVMLDPDTVFSPDSRKAALKAVGGVLEAVDAVMDGGCGRAFCAVRPPGHHAEPGRAMGFCIFNNIAVGAAYALKRDDVQSVVIVDWDLHHGNGTQSIFYDTADVMYVSLHQFPHYPGSGSSSEIGEGDGRGFTLNFPMSPGSDDGDYRKVLTDKILPAIDGFKPQLLLISAGFDAHRDDPLGSINLSSEFFGEMTSMLRKLADKHCGGKMISVLEGGYSSQALGESIRFHLEEMTR
jgi:acetoin utilization deacetylase AcuC-like enzyme